MSFIRTKDGKIFDLENKKVSSWEYIDNDTAINEYGVEGAFYTIYYFDENEGHYSECDGKGGHSCDFIDEKDILKQANTIKELCDEFHIEYDSLSFSKEINYVKYYDFEIAKNNLEDGDTLYGVIHIKGKGLIYVAKMDSDGKLELI